MGSRPMKITKNFASNDNFIHQSAIADIPRLFDSILVVRTLLQACKWRPMVLQIIWKRPNISWKYRQKKRERKKSLPLGPDRIFVFRLLYNLCLLAYDHPEKLP